MMIPFIIHSLSFLVLLQGVNSGFCLLRHTKTWLANDVFLRTLLHHKLSLSQVALLFFMLLFAITQLLCHVYKHCKHYDNICEPA